MKITKVHLSDKAPHAIGPYSQAVKCENFIFCSGQIGVNPTSGLLVEGGIEAETVQVFRNLSEILKAAGLSFSHVVRVDIFTTDMSSFMQINKIYAKYFKKDPKPARQTVEVTKLPKKARIEVSCIAHLD